jgi:hypothetical protein
MALISKLLPSPYHIGAQNHLACIGRPVTTTRTCNPNYDHCQAETLNATRQLTTIMSDQPNASPPNPTLPRIVPATPPRVAVAAPWRVATASITITAPNTIQQVHLVHQRLTRHNNPFQILADNDNDDDTNTVVASNCSPQAPHPKQRPQTIQPPSQPPTTVPTTVCLINTVIG